MSSNRRLNQGEGSRFYGSASVTVSALAAAAEEDLSITDTNAEVDHVVSVSFANAAMETGLSVSAAWVSAAGTIKVRISNQSGSGLTGGANTIYYTLEK
ncbi:MAG: hypothetical protein GTN36_05465 [Candidatus Aenigmarchaeota archaeon]|nr:hypothetical protein [Candidatus Aenigmarchaeota archaeon]